MTPDERREMLMVLAELWTLSPDVRLGQLLSTLDFWAKLSWTKASDTSMTTNYSLSCTVIGQS